MSPRMPSQRLRLVTCHTLHLCSWAENSHQSRSSVKSSETSEESKASAPPIYKRFSRALPDATDYTRLSSSPQDAQSAPQSTQIAQEPKATTSPAYRRISRAMSNVPLVRWVSTQESEAPAPVPRAQIPQIREEPAVQSTPAYRRISRAISHASFLRNSASYNGTLSIEARKAEETTPTAVDTPIHRRFSRALSDESLAQAASRAEILEDENQAWGSPPRRQSRYLSAV
ncbi:hypothetical protein H0H81_002729 [Sphagnurus paluster]|uniref:Uncharacterized protein n=1 Tax=Sphagnurus paluster TaxID=117069 RepID=A0A9P7K4H0_9AGAR|nr:hypothetical protein H0H81_002729 [Sphagnurus paluster]